MYYICGSGFFNVFRNFKHFYDIFLKFTQFCCLWGRFLHFRLWGTKLCPSTAFRVDLRVDLSSSYICYFVWSLCIQISIWIVFLFARLCSFFCEPCNFIRSLFRVDLRVDLKGSNAVFSSIFDRSLFGLFCI